jgi:polyhydroxyalkanoate synthase
MNQNPSDSGIPGDSVCSEIALDPQTFLTGVPRKEGSWWPEWVDWLKVRSGASIVPPPISTLESDYTSLGDSPGIYVLEE